jgi:DedD protein
LAHQAQDDAFREIQLNGKQLVFLFMVATVVSVVIFLCGVFVGRGVRAERAPLLADAGTSTPVTTPDVRPVEPPPTAAGSDPTAAAPPPAVDELSYFNRLEKSGQPADDLKPVAQKPVEKPARVEKPAPEKLARAEKSASAAKPAPAATPVPAAERSTPLTPPAPPPAAPRAAAPPPPPAPKEPPAASSNPSPAVAAAAPEPSGQGFALQVTALRERGEAEAIAKRLSSKGYTAYVLTPANGSPSVYRVRIGKFKTRREAEAIATRLQKEEQFTPWITR